MNTAQHDSLVRRLLRAHALFMSSLVSSTISFAIGILLAAGMGARDYGTYASAVALLGVVAIVADGGWFATVARHLSASTDPDGERAALRVAWCAFVAAGAVASLLVACLALLSGDLFPSATRHALWVASPLACGVLVPYFLEQMYKGLGRPGTLASVTLAGRGLALAVALALTATQAGPTIAVAALTAAPLAAVALALYLTPPGRGKVRSAYASLRGEHRRFGRQLFVGRAANLLAFRADIVLLAALFPPSDVGFYVLANSMLSPVVMFGQASSAASVPRHARRTARRWLGTAQCGVRRVACPGRRARVRADHDRPVGSRILTGSRTAAARRAGDVGTGGVPAMQLVASLERGRTSPPPPAPDHRCCEPGG